MRFYQTNLADEQLSRLLVAADLPESHSAGPVPVGFLHTSSGGGGLPGSLGGQLLPGGLPSGGFASSLLGSSHGELDSSWFELTVTDFWSGWQILVE